MERWGLLVVVGMLVAYGVVKTLRRQYCVRFHENHVDMHDERRAMLIIAERGR